ncbi:retention module-containing protein [Halomonas sp. EGI 63088]|uniref:Retention module-containing protein n=1 Tax=Halomonas flagellata TaxID=2920385 RepID=A0ABS9RUV6_9GAMM|nr:retention module-containing protein [Halomonas flagellata]MCH4563636.1 retention module-containing protein [Halomonas flagellata]
MTIATVVSISGLAWARDADGHLRELRVGDTLQEGETLVTSDNARVELDFGDGLDPTLVEGGQEIAMTPELDADRPVAVEDASALDEDLEALLSALDEDDVDLLDILDATAAGAGSGGGGGAGHSFVRLTRIAEDNPDSLAFDFSVGQLGGPTDAEGILLEAVDAPEAEEPGVEALGEEGPGEEGPGEDGPGEDGPGEDRPGEDGPGEDGPGEDGPGEDGPGEDGPGEDGPGEEEDEPEVEPEPIIPAVSVDLDVGAFENTVTTSLTGTSTDAVSITISIVGGGLEETFTVTPDADGSWEVDVSGLSFEEGVTYEATATATSSDGNTATATDTSSFTLVKIEGLLDAGDVTVNEGFLESGTQATQGEPRGSGTFTISAAGGFASLTVYGKEGAEEFTFAALEGLSDDGVTIAIETEHGLLTLAGFEDLGDGRYEVTYEYLLSEAFEHPEGDGRNEADKGPIDIKVTDSNGNTAADQVNVTIIDDVPVREESQNAILSTQAGAVLTGDSGLRIGADIDDAVVSDLRVDTNDDGKIIGYYGDGESSILLSNGQALTSSFDVEAGTFTAYNGDGDPVFSIALDVDSGEYAIELHEKLDAIAVEFENESLSVDGGGNDDDVLIFNGGSFEASELGIRFTNQNPDEGVNHSAQGLGGGSKQAITSDDVLIGTFSQVMTELTIGVGEGNNQPDDVRWQAYLDGELVSPVDDDGNPVWQSGNVIEISSGFDEIWLTAEGDGSYRARDFDGTFGSKELDYYIKLEFDVEDGDGDSIDGSFDLTFSPDNVFEGAEGNDVIVGTSESDILVGGAGGDILAGGLGDDVFKWNFGDQSEEDAAATDIVKDFSEGHNVLDIADLLQGMDEGADIASYLHASEEDGNTVLHISSEGNLAVDGADISGADQVIVLEGVGYGSDILQQLMDGGQLQVD